MFSCNRWVNGFNFHPLKNGKQEPFGLPIMVQPIRTMEALCYMLEFEKSPSQGQGLTLSSPTNLGVDNLERMNWYVAAKNTWQGIIPGHWTYDNIPLKFYGELKKKIFDYNEIRIKEHEWNYIKGSTLSFEKCFDEITGHDDFQDQNCHSIFDPKSFKYEKRYFNQL